jgi:hypothetical protein
VTLTYVYCLVRAARRPSRLDASAAMPGAHDLAALEAGPGLWLIVSHVPAASYDEAAVAEGLQDLAWVGRHALAHEAVVERFLRARAVLPLQLFTLFTTDDRARAYVQQQRRRIERILARVERQVEWGVRLTLEDRPLSAMPGPPAARGRAARETEAAAATGTAYLARKRDAREASRLRLTEARSAGERAFRALARQATASRRMTATETAAPASRLLVEAAFLVPAANASSFRAAVRRHRPALEASGVAVSLTGPWPPYNFVQPPARSE